jgi:serine/threonine protein kinase
MPYAKHGDLRKFLRTHFSNCSWSQRITMLYYIAQGLGNIHSAGLIHRDFHTGNILQMSHNYSYIGDLGLSMGVNGFQDKRQIFGVVPYIAPEVFRGKGYSKASDIYSFSMVMWEIATGSPPFGKRAHDEYLIIDICKNERPDIGQDIPSCYAQLMKQCWHDDPSERPSCADIQKTLWKWRTDIDKDTADDIKMAEEYRLENMGMAMKSGTESLHAEAVYQSRLMLLSDSNAETKPISIHDVKSGK